MWHAPQPPHRTNQAGQSPPLLALSAHRCVAELWCVRLLCNLSRCSIRRRAGSSSYLRGCGASVLLVRLRTLRARALRCIRVRGLGISFEELGPLLHAKTVLLGDHHQAEVVKLAAFLN